MIVSKTELDILKTKFYSYKGQDYEVIKFVKMKDVVNGIWVFAVEYKRVDTEIGWEGSFVRYLPDFAMKFKPTDEIH